MDAIRPKTRAKSAAPAKAEAAAEAAFVAEIGRLIRLGRARRGISRRQLAQSSGISERYLAQIEGGRGNPSAIVLSTMTEGLPCPLSIWAR